MNKKLQYYRVKNDERLFRFKGYDGPLLVLVTADGTLPQHVKVPVDDVTSFDQEADFYRRFDGPWTTLRSR